VSGRADHLSGSDLYQALGGMDACRKLSTAFYARVARDPVLRPIFPSSFHCAIEAFALYLGQFLGGPCEYSRQRWWLSLREGHLRFKIGQKERDAWVANMLKALDDVAIEEPLNGALRRFFEQSSAYLINQSKPAEKASGDHGEIGQRWKVQRAIDEAVAAVRRGDAQRAIALTESSLVRTYFERDRMAFVSLLAVMTASGQPALLDYVRQRLLVEPGLAHERHTYGRTLLHDAAGSGTLAMVKLLLQLGADPNAMDEAGHTPLYCVGNECSADSGRDVVRTLARAGADLNANGGVKQCTALHMAARRGNVGVAEALLDCGADIEARDTAGDTPLRRAVNCSKIEVVALLISQGADAGSKGSKGLTVRQAARSAVMKKLLKA